MAVNLKLVFGGEDGRDVGLSFPFANAASDPALVKALMTGIVAGGDIYAEPPLTPKSANFVVNTVVPVDLS